MKINKDLHLYGLIGHPTKHSLSPLMHNAAFKEMGIKAKYLLIDVEPGQLKEFLLNPLFAFKSLEGEDLVSRDLKGFNVTIPYKVKAKEILEANFQNSQSPEANHSLLVGAINTVLRSGKGFNWFNTDALGFMQAIKKDLKLKGQNKLKVLVIGCGGAGRAVISGLSLDDDDLAEAIYVFEINPQVAASASKHFANFPKASEKLQFIKKEDIPPLINQCSLLVNASSLGMNEADSSPINKSLLHKDLRVYDLVYNRQTQLIKDAESLGIQAEDGLSMLLHQGVKALSYWLDREIPEGVVEMMKKALKDKIRSKNA
ncbi:MAG: shikimate dehydrogenase [Candidatus Omnitrophica bacterium]|nr:shikimate dehydrogenase [Candidatus Omnitrophota bacterium]